MSLRNFNNTSALGSLTAPVASSATTFTTLNFTGIPAAPFTVTVDRNTATEEICLVTAVVGSTLTVVRGYDGTAGQAHSAGAPIEHTAGAIEYTEANVHTNATSNVHGSTGSVVGNQGAQTIFDKTLVSPVCQADTVKGDAVVAYVPPGMSAKNLFSGKGTDGLTKFTVDSSGNVIGAGVNLTTVNSTVAGHTTTLASHTTSINNNTTSITGLGTTKADKTYVDSQDAATLASAKTYTDARAIPPDSGWTNVVGFANGWSNYVGTGTYAPARYRKLSNGMVEVQGHVAGGTIGTTIAVFTLPTGYRPDYVLMFPQVGNGAIARVDMQSDGKVCVAIGSSAVYTSINFTFYADH